MKDMEAAGKLYFHELLKIHELDMPMVQRVRFLLEMLNNVSAMGVADSGISIHTIFSMLSYIGQKYKLPAALLYQANKFRLWANENRISDNLTDESGYKLGLYCMSRLISGITGVGIPSEVMEIIPGDPKAIVEEKIKKRFIKSMRFTALERDGEKKWLIGCDATEPGKRIKVLYHIEGMTDPFLPGLELLGEDIPLPIEINLLDVETDNNGYYLPKALVIQPDYLIDITAIAECFKASGVFPVSYLLKKLMPMEPNKHIILGNIANFFLDELITNPSISFRILMEQSFRINPLAFSLFPDEVVQEIVHKSRKHYTSLKQMVKVDFARHGIDIKRVLLEPTFYSERYGLQGRLDIFHIKESSNGEAAIVELKSSKLYRPNIYGLNQPHYIQTLLYDLLIKSMSGDRLRPTNYILYSVKDQDHLRFAPAVKSQQYEALAVRNEIVGLEYKLASFHSTAKASDYIEWIQKMGQKASGFMRRDVDQIIDRLSGLNHLEQQYFFLFLGFISREQILAKIGDHRRNDNGQASLWLKTLEEKEEDYIIISHLELKESQIDRPDPILIFSKSSKTNPLANFRKGDLAILYPSDRPPLGHQLFKGTISELDANIVCIRLRSKQLDNDAFVRSKFWNIEHDMLDSSFNIYFQSLFTFAGFSLERRQLFLGIRPPGRPRLTESMTCEGLTEEQNRIFRKILALPDYFLLWGPPGTGKTNVMLKQVVKHLFQNPDEQILIVAYTNRAVDEICRSLEDLGPEWKDRYIRIGSRYSTHPDFRLQLLVEKMMRIRDRKGLHEILSGFRIIISTVTSLAGCKEVFHLKKFSRIIVDEATQILEPLMAGILPRVPWALLIGDHQQLAAVVAQPKRQRLVKDPGLRAIGLVDMGNSYFERLYKRCIEEDWNWAYDKLTFQGRMHEEIMAFPSEYFYQESLRTLPGNNNQAAALSFLSGLKDPLEQILATKRVLFFPVRSREVMTSKTNFDEAVVVADVVLAFERLIHRDKRLFHEETLGVMTPYRAQIAQITSLLRQRGFDPGMITIDTVERYQGGARDIIIISLCTNTPGQLATLVSEGEEGVDRKLNVALTRAREHLIVIGDPGILSGNSVYSSFIERYSVEVEINSS